MRQSRASINSQLKQMKRFTTEKLSFNNYQKVISKQQEVIESLRYEILLLKSYISLEKASTPFQANCSDISITSTCTSLNQSQLRAEQEQSAAQIATKKYEKLIKSLAQIIQIPSLGIFDEEQILQNIQKLKQISVKKQEPIFIERIKETKVPITVQKVVQKIVEKIVYVDKPVFKQKIVQKFVEQKPQATQESSSAMLNKTYSERNLKQKRYEDTGYDRYESRYEQRKYEPNRKTEAGNHLIKKRGDYGKSYYRKEY